VKVLACYSIQNLTPCDKFCIIHWQLSHYLSYTLYQYAWTYWMNCVLSLLWEKVQ